MSDLHTRLLAAVQQRMDVARAATPGPWSAKQDRSFRAGRYVPTRITAGEGPAVAADLMKPEDATHIAANDPATVIRHCERDLRVLERHRAINMNPPAACQTCCDRVRSADILWPCSEILDLAAAYAVEVDRG